MCARFLNGFFVTPLPKLYGCVVSALCVTLVSSSVGLSQATAAGGSTGKASANQAEKPAVIEDLKVFLPPYSTPKRNLTCDEKLGQGLCQARVREMDLWRKGYGELKTGDALFRLQEYQGAKQHCLLAVEDSRLPFGYASSHILGPSLPPDYSNDAQECVKKIERAQDEIDLRSLKSLTAVETLNLRMGDIDRAKAVHEELRKEYTSLVPSSVCARSFAERHLGGTEANWSGVLAWFRSKLTLLGAQVFVVFLALVWLYLLLRTARLLRNWVRGFSRQTTKWFVQNIRDDQNQAAAGAVMDALSISGNALLRKPFMPPALLLVPPGFGGPSGGGIWWNCFGAVRPPFEIEKLPRAEIERHQFVLQDGLEEVNLKVGGSEISGVVSLARNVSRWFNKGTPTVQGAILKLNPTGQSPSWAVRLTATSAFKWAPWLRHSPEIEHGQALSMSVYSSTEEQEFVDAIGLAAQRAAFKLFYRLAKPGKDTDEITAVAAFHQGVVLLRRYL